MSHSNKRKDPPLSPGDVETRECLEKTVNRSWKKQKQGDQLGGEPLPRLPPTTHYLPFGLGGSHWRGKRSLETIVIFGDSYSKSNGAEHEESDTWVEYLLRKSRKESHARIYNFAFPGATAEDDLSSQFLSLKKSFREAPDSGRTTYFFYFGINDCGRTDSNDLEPMVEAVFDALHDLYTKFSARNFVLIDVPPIDRSPGASESGSDGDIKNSVQTWNELLRAKADDFATGTANATIFIFSSHRILTEVLDEPLEFDFAEDDPETECAGIWVDELHLKPAVHAIFAEHLWDSLTKA